MNGFQMEFRVELSCLFWLLPFSYFLKWRPPAIILACGTQYPAAAQCTVQKINPTSSPYLYGEEVQQRPQ